MFPPEFDPVTYRKNYRDLWRVRDVHLQDHYKKYGRSEGRIATSAVPRVNFLNLIPANQSVLEIGPFARPCLTGPKVKYFDVMDRTGLADRVRRLKPSDMTPENVPEIHYVSPTGDLSVVDQYFDNVFSSHCIEHQPDVVHHLQQVQEILSDGGCYFLIVPDKRYCFDHYLPESTIAEVLEAHTERRRTHTLANVIKHRALTSHNEPARYWRGDNGNPPCGMQRVSQAIIEYKAANGAYIDVHSLFFTPASFRNIFRLLFESGITKLKPVRVYDTPVEWNEFCAILQKT